MATDLTCIICPNGCRLHVDDDLNVIGNKCLRGVAYGRQEVTDPRRTVTSTCRTNSRLLSVCPVKTKDAISKKLIFKVMEEVNKVSVKVPVRLGEVIIKDVAGSGVDLVATRDILE